MTSTSVALREPTSLQAHLEMLRRYAEVRTHTMKLVAPSPEDQMVQSMPDASPTKWHLAHTTWFFETFILSPHVGLASQAATQLMKHDALGAHARDELGISETLTAKSVQAAVASAGTFAAGAVLSITGCVCGQSVDYGSNVNSLAHPHTSRLTH